MKINKSIKTICIILLIILFLNCLPSTSFAGNTDTILNMYKGNASDDDTGNALTETRMIIGKIISIVQVFGVFIAVAMLISLGIKYMYASPGEKAQIKQGLTVYVIGAVVMFAAAGILGIIKSFYTNINVS